MDLVMYELWTVVSSCCGQAVDVAGNVLDMRQFEWKMEIWDVVSDRNVW